LESAEEKIDGGKKKIVGKMRIAKKRRD